MRRRHMSRERAYDEERTVWKVLRYVVIVCVLLVTLFPLFWMVSTSFKPVHEWTPPRPRWVSQEPTLYNYVTVFLGPGRARGGWWRSDAGVRDSVDVEGATIRISGESSFFIPFLNSLIICSFLRELLSTIKRVIAARALGLIFRVPFILTFRKNQIKEKAPARLLPSINI